MNRRNLVQAVLASADGLPLSPVQLQKAVFLLDRNAPELINDGMKFHFEPYDYGPFDRDVYVEADVLSSAGLAYVLPSGVGNWNIYQASERGLAQGRQLLDQLPKNLSDYIREVTHWVRSQSFSGLVRSIYDQYPEMKANSIFQG